MIDSRDVNKRYRLVSDMELHAEVDRWKRKTRRNDLANVAFLIILAALIILSLFLVKMG